MLLKTVAEPLRPPDLRGGGIFFCVCRGSTRRPDIPFLGNSPIMWPSDMICFFPNCSSTCPFRSSPIAYERRLTMLAFTVWTIATASRLPRWFGPPHRTRRLLRSLVTVLVPVGLSITPTPAFALQETARLGRTDRESAAPPMKPPVGRLGARLADPRPGGQRSRSAAAAFPGSLT